MKIDFNRVLIGLDGKKALQASDVKDGAQRDMTLKDAAITAICNWVEPDDRSLTGEQAFRRTQLARKISEGGVVEITAEDISLIQNRAAKLLPVVTAGVAYELLNKPEA